jgi:hypothetical protein
VTVTRVHGTGTFVLVIPRGVVLHGGDTGMQGLMTARATTVRFVETQPTATVGIETFCTDEFALMPPDHFPLAFDSTQAEETNPVRKLMACLETNSATHQVKQLAVWAVGDKLIDMSPAAAEGALRAAMYKNLRADRLAQIQGPWMQRVRRDHPALTDEAANRIAQEEIDSEETRLTNLAGQTASDQISTTLRAVRPVLEACGYDVTHLALFQ